MHACMDALVADEVRNDLIADLATREATDGHTVLVLSGRVAHCRRLAKMVRERGVDAEVLVGAVKKSKRKEILDRFRSGELPVVVASTLADEGLDVPRMDRVILAFPSRTKGRTAQRLGRLMRPHPDKSGAVLFDIVDASVAPLLRQFRERNRLYKRLAAGIQRRGAG
jgi:superfamily II DNA or RNA helicase